ncbi:MAG: hemerythrin domain-containing protein [Magnetospiraceae bacterium]
MRLELKEEWIIGHPQIDDEHRQLVVLLNDLLDKARQKDHPAVQHGISTFLDQTRQHFINEIMIMKSFGYTEGVRHARQHTRQLNEIRVLFKQTNETNIDRMMATLTDIMIRDVLQDDLHFRDYLLRRKNGHRVAPPETESTP